ncbi:hypothetical protein JRQ81_017826 [Phrynocephalus forsythii]|uniref:Secreted protein n=1 Tax=Phrynocephalus forsythii TaxID=171643 RepID=A0A9Q1B0J9_9SAUR|nr:hypothetical protein JRQ81_017826 [Phrynocephalus forsythii]
MRTLSFCIGSPDFLHLFPLFSCALLGAWPEVWGRETRTKGAAECLNPSPWIGTPTHLAGMEKTKQQAGDLEEDGFAHVSFCGSNKLRSSPAHNVTHKDANFLPQSRNSFG